LGVLGKWQQWCCAVDWGIWVENVSEEWGIWKVGVRDKLDDVEGTGCVRITSRVGAGRR